MTLPAATPGRIGVEITRLGVGARAIAGGGCPSVDDEIASAPAAGGAGDRPVRLSQA